MAIDGLSVVLGCSLMLTVTVVSFSTKNLSSDLYKKQGRPHEKQTFDQQLELQHLLLNPEYQF